MALMEGLANRVASREIPYTRLTALAQAYHSEVRRPLGLTYAANVLDFRPAQKVIDNPHGFVPKEVQGLFRRLWDTVLQRRERWIEHTLLTGERVPFGGVLGSSYASFVGDQTLEYWVVQGDQHLKVWNDLHVRAALLADEVAETHLLNAVEITRGIVAPMPWEQGNAGVAELFFKTSVYELTGEIPRLTQGWDVALTVARPNVFLLDEARFAPLIFQEGPHLQVLRALSRRVP